MPAGKATRGADQYAAPGFTRFRQGAEFSELGDGEQRFRRIGVPHRAPPDSLTAEDEAAARPCCNIPGIPGAAGIPARDRQALAIPQRQHRRIPATVQIVMFRLERHAQASLQAGCVVPRHMAKAQAGVVEPPLSQQFITLRVQPHQG
jgi:hypothetical protein